MKILSYKKVIAIVCFCAMAMSCDDSFLDLIPESNVNSVNFFKSKQDIDLAVSAAYATLYTCYGPMCGASYCGEQMSDNGTMYNVITPVADKWAFKDYELLPSNAVVYSHWQQYYNGLFNINIVIERIGGAQIEAEYRDRIIAEMKFLRALYYFNMVQMWGDLPIVTKTYLATESYDVLRSPASEVYALIIQDLSDAIETLPPKVEVSAPGKVSLEAAQTLLGKVYLTMNNKTAAEDVLLDVYGKFQLDSNYANLWIHSNKNTIESIFEIQYKGGTGNPYSTYYPAFAPFENFAITSYSEGMNMVTEDLWNEYEAGDPRRDISIDTGYTKNEVFVPIKFPKKWVDKTVTYSYEYCNNNFMVLRYADVLLMLAEATGNESYLNEVRDRVGLPLYGEAGYPSTLYPTIDLAIEHERRVELALEFHRWFDLKRTGRATTVLTAKKGKTITEADLLLPIPEKVRQQNPDITQNSAYTD